MVDDVVVVVVVVVEDEVVVVELEVSVGQVVKRIDTGVLVTTSEVLTPVNSDMVVLCTIARCQPQRYRPCLTLRSARLEHTSS